MAPHVLLVTIDSLRADHLGCYGRRKIDTPNLDAFAASGVRFDQHLTSVSVTLPSHTSLMTGCTPLVHGVTFNGMTVPRRRKTLAEIAGPSGYATSAITSWGGFARQEGLGFQYWYSQSVSADLENRGERTLERVVQRLKDIDPTKPQLFWVHFIDPHAPDNCPEPYPVSYEGEVRFIDMIVGKLIGAWDQRLGADRSLAIITADHGEHLNDHDIERGHGTLWEIALHVPLMMRMPGLIQPGAVVPELTRQIDVAPTILDYTRLPMPYNIEGMSLRGLIEGTDNDLQLVHQGQVVKEGVYTATMRNAQYGMHFGDARDLACLFDRRNDRHEVKNLILNGAVVRHSAAHSIADATAKTV